MREGREKGGRARLVYLSRGPGFLVTPLLRTVCRSRHSYSSSKQSASDVVKLLYQVIVEIRLHLFAAVDAPPFED